MKSIRIFFLLQVFVFSVFAQQSSTLKITGDNWEAIVDNTNGTLNSLTFADGEIVKFRTDSLMGPSWGNVELKQTKTPFLFSNKKENIIYSIKYKTIKGKLGIVLTLKNTGDETYSPKNERFNLGIDTEMKSYPEWNDIVFPTLMRCEKTHFWGYLMSPNGKIITIGSKDPIASYVLNYQGKQDEGMHRISTVSLDVLHEQPLPLRHPDQSSLKPGEERNWTILLQESNTLADVKSDLAVSINSPMIEAERYSIQEHEKTLVTIHSTEDIKAELLSPGGEKLSLQPQRLGKNKFAIDLSLNNGAGVYKMEVTNAKGQISEACFTQLKPYSWYMEKARSGAISDNQRASSHLEQWLGLTSGVNASRFVPNPKEDALVDAQLMKVLDLQWDLVKKVPDNIPHRYRLMSNTAQMAGLLAYRYLKDEQISWLDWSSGLADYVLTCQSPEGYYKPEPTDNLIYTSVFYPAKSVMEVMAVEKMAATKDVKWQEAYDRHYNSVKKAMDHLVRVGDNIDTEGQLTYEDGMISCSASQLGLFALIQEDPENRKVYAEAARQFLKGHSCLEQLLIPDSRMNGATLRFWESQYDILLRGSFNMMNSPHGWSAWLIPALWYQYLLTGEEVWLTKTFNALGSCIQVISSETGELRWAFIPDPYVEVTKLVENPLTPGRGKRVSEIIGEQYMPKISSFHYPEREPVSGNSDTVGWTCDNDVHEIFTAMEEVALTSCYLLERESGELITWNCSAVKQSDGSITVHPNENVISRLHVNLSDEKLIRVSFNNSSEATFPVGGMQWIGPGGLPILLNK